MGLYKITYKKTAMRIMIVEAKDEIEAKERYEEFECLEDYEISGIEEEVESIEKRL